MNRSKIVILASSILIIGTLVPLSVYLGMSRIVDENRFCSKIIRNLPSDDYLNLVLEIENIDGDSLYFDSLSEDLKGQIENVTALIEREEAFLSNYNQKEYSKWGDRWKWHNFTYIATLSFEFDEGDIIDIIEETFSRITFYFYNNFSAFGYVALDDFTNEFNENYTSWDIEENIDRILNMEEPPMLIHQKVVISDVFAPLAGTGTSFERLFLCDSFGLPLLFISNEGAWWIS